MSNLISYSDNMSLLYGEALDALHEAEEKIREKHKKVSEKKTNPNHVKQKAGMDYVEFAYMKSMANKYYPGWSFQNLIIIEQMLNAGWVAVQGELHFLDEGIKRVGACAAAHRIAFKSGKDRVPENIVDLGNDVKAAVTDALKKGFNTYMNISDDIYRHLEVEPLTKGQITVLYEIVEKCKPESQRKFYNFVDNNMNSTNAVEMSEKLLKSMASYVVEKEGQKTAEEKFNEYKSKLKELGIRID